MKQARQNLILELIGRYEIETQEELAGMLKENGYAVTQATVSRDIRELGLRKRPGSRTKAYVYCTVPAQETLPEARYLRVLSDSVISMDLAMNLLVIKTSAGMAMAAAAALDHCRLPEIVGCIGGDDTIFCAVRTAHEASALKQKIEQIMQH